MLSASGFAGCIKVKSFADFIQMFPSVAFTTYNDASHYIHITDHHLANIFIVSIYCESTNSPFLDDQYGGVWSEIQILDVVPVAWPWSL